MEKGGIPAVVKLAGKTGVTRQTAAATRETPELLAKFREALGEHCFERFLSVKKKEWDEFRIQVTEYELKKYLPIL